MTATLLALHGFTQNGARMQAHLAPLAARAGVQLVCPDAPHPCAEASVERMHGTPASWPAPPYLCWWDASDDGRVYRGWERTLACVRRWLATYPQVVVLGFSQGGILAGLIAAMAAREALPPIQGVVVVAGRAPRAERLQGWLDPVIDVPSLHVWGERDPIAGPPSQALADRFAPARREVVVWPGPHVVPTRGPGADAIVGFVERQLRRGESP